MRWTVARVAKAHRDGTLGVLKGLLGGDGCPWEARGSSCCAALWRRSTAARPAAPGATRPLASSGSAGSSSGASLKHTTVFQTRSIYIFYLSLNAFWNASKSWSVFHTFLFSITRSIAEQISNVQLTHINLKHSATLRLLSVFFLHLPV